LLAAHHAHHESFGGRLALARHRCVDRVLDPFSLRVTVSPPHRREYRVPGRDEHCGDGVELRAATGIVLAAVVPDDRRERAGTIGVVRVANERERAARIGNALLVVERRLGCRWMKRRSRYQQERAAQNGS